MKKLTSQEKEIVKAIAKTTIYTEVDIWKVYNIVGSFDKTLKIMKHSVLLGVTPYDMIGIINDFNNQP